MGAIDRDGPLPGPALKARRDGATATVAGLSRRQLLRRALGAASTLWMVEVLAGTVGFLWPTLGSSLSAVRVGTLQDLILLNPGIPVADGFPAYVAEAHAFVVVVDPARGGFVPGADVTGIGTEVNVRALYQRCPHLGCRPNPCLEDFWFHCPCHQSRYDRLGIKPEGQRYGPAARGMDRFPVTVDADGVLTIDATQVIVGPLPIALGQPGVIPPRIANGCI